MRYLLAVTLMIGLALAPAQGQEAAAPDAATLSVGEWVAQGMQDGRLAARQQSTGGRFLGGFVAGAGLGLLGTGLVYALASGSPDVPAEHLVAIQEQPAPYQVAFQEAYKRDIRARRQQNAVIGGLVGTAAFVTVWLVATSQ
jgi:hypothetical protein